MKMIMVKKRLNNRKKSEIKNLDRILGDQIVSNYD